MADGLRTEIIARDFNRMLEELAAIDPRVEFADVVRSEAASVMSGALSRTRAATVSAINKRAEGKRFYTFGGKTYFVENRFPDHVWAEIVRRQKEALATKLGARGLAKQTWYHMAAKMGKQISVAGYISAANYRGQQYAQDAEPSETGSAAEFILTAVNTSPLGEGAQMRAAMISAMNGRTRYFQRNMESRAFQSLASRARKYPGIFTSPVPAPI